MAFCMARSILGVLWDLDLPALRWTVAQAHRTYQAAKYQDVIGQISPMLSIVDQAVRTDGAEHLAVNMAEQIQANSRSNEPVLVSLTGAMSLIGSVIAARRMDRDEAWA